MRLRAQREGRSMQEVAREAVRDYIDRTSRRELLDEVARLCVGGMRGTTDLRWAV